MGDTLTDNETTTTTEAGDHDLYSHYCTKADIERSMFDGVTITALCGKQWRPSRDFQAFPVCPDCKTAYETLPND